MRHEYLQQALTEHSTVSKLVALIMAIYRQSKAVVKGKANDLRAFNIGRGVPHGDCLSPVYSSAHWTLSSAKSTRKKTVSSQQLALLFKIWDKPMM